VGRKVDKVANKVDQATNANLVKAREANIRVTGLTMSKGKNLKTTYGVGVDGAARQAECY
jgi:hypothetical protein